MPVKYSLTATVIAWLALFALLASATLEAETSLTGSFRRPFRSIYEKTRNLGKLGYDAFNMGRLWGRSGQVPSRARSAPDTTGSGDFTDYKAMCVFSRGPRLKSSPTLFYFSSEVNTEGCEVEVEIELASHDNYRELNRSEARRAIQKKLVETGYYDGARPTYIITHGFLANWKGNWLCNTKDLILNKSRANVFIVDWSGGSRPMVPIDYGASVSNTQYVAALIGQFIELLLPMTGQQNAKNFHLIGHSLGAHISGFVGYSVQSVGQITALDPAGPCFSTRSLAESESAGEDGIMRRGKRRLSPQSADFVLALHTDTSLFGLDENCAHYDVYVNGGARQPDCGASSASTRLEDLFRLDLSSTFNFNLACCHSYAHQLLDTFIDFSGWLGPARDHDGLAVASRREMRGKCFPMAYRCLDWDAFKAGECGFCRDNDTLCIFTGISLYNYQRVRTKTEEAIYQLGDQSARERPDSDDDLRFNDEFDELEAAAENELETISQDGQSSALTKRGQHFLKAAAGKPVCVFHYQVLVAARRAQDVSKHLFYLHLPLDKWGGFHDDEGNRLASRLVRVSHVIKPESVAYKSLRATYMATLSERLDGVDGSRNDVEFYSALITFRQAPAEACRPDGQSAAGANKDIWQLCEPLDTLREARLWSSSSDKLAAVEWVAVNYMSGLTLEQRLAESYVLFRDRRAPIKRRDEIEESDRARLSALKPRSSSGLKRSAKKVARTADFFLDILNCQSTDPKQNFRCRRSSSELKFAVDLMPNKL